MNVKRAAENTRILLESGTNELEIVEFSINGNHYGINVAKVREIIRYPDSVIPVPDAHPSFEGIANIRGKVIPIINLQTHLGTPEDRDRASSFIIISEFNHSMTGFCVSSVARIHRLSWEQIESPSGLLCGEGGCIVAIVKFDDRMILLLDFEKITADINPESGMHAESVIGLKKEEHKIDRSSKKILVAEDSRYILKIIHTTLKEAGYQVHTASDGQKAWEYLTSLVNNDTFRSIDDHVNILISDIEMPRMDGLHLIKNIKSHQMLRNLPCIVFSSLINDEMALKCKSVGADAQMSKPELGSLVEIVDNIVASLG